MAEDSIKQVPNKRRVSLVSQYINKIDNRRDKVLCKICNLELNFYGTTGSLLRHLSIKHKIEIKQKLPSLQSDNEHYTIDSSKLQPEAASNDNSENYINPYENIKLPIEEYIQLEDINYRSDEMTPDEERIVAEIEYFREKAAYYKMQKNLVAMQAAKVKKELKDFGI